MRVGGNGGNPKKAESHLRRSESTQGAPGVQGGLFGVQEGAVGSQEVAGKWRCMNDFSQKVEDFSRFFEIGSFRPWRRRRWSRLAERSPKPVFPLKTDHGKWVSIKTRKIRRFSRRTSPPGYWPVTRPGNFCATLPQCARTENLHCSHFQGRDERSTVGFETASHYSEHNMYPNQITMTLCFAR